VPAQGAIRSSEGLSVNIWSGADGTRLYPAVHLWLLQRPLNCESAGHSVACSLFDAEEVRGSIPLAPTTRRCPRQRFACQRASSDPPGIARMLRQPTGPSLGGRITDAPAAVARSVIRRISSTSTYGNHPTHPRSFSATPPLSGPRSRAT